jgi:hypothetical protein
MHVHAVELGGRDALDYSWRDAALSTGVGLATGAAVGGAVGATAEIRGPQTYEETVSREVDRHLEEGVSQDVEYRSFVTTRGGTFRSEGVQRGTQGSTGSIREPAGISKSEVAGDWHLHAKDTPDQVWLSPDDMEAAEAREAFYGPRYRSTVVDKEGNLWAYSSRSKPIGGGTYPVPDRLVGSYRHFLPEQQAAWRNWAAGAAGGAIAGAFANR